MCIYRSWQILPLNVHFTSSPSHAKKLYLHMFDMVDTAFSYERELIKFLQNFSGKGGSLLCTYCIFTLWDRFEHNHRNHTSNEVLSS